MRMATLPSTTSNKTLISSSSTRNATTQPVPPSSSTPRSCTSVHPSSSHPTRLTKVRQRYLKDLYESATGDSFKESDPEIDLPPPPPTKQQPKYAPSYPTAGTTMSKRGPTLKPWLTKKMRETTALTDPKFVDSFLVLCVAYTDATITQ